MPGHTRGVRAVKAVLGGGPDLRCGCSAVFQTVVNTIDGNAITRDEIKSSQYEAAVLDGDVECLL